MEGEVLFPFTKIGPPTNLDPIICACNQEKQIREVWFAWTITKVGESPHYNPVCRECFLVKITAGNA